MGLDFTSIKDSEGAAVYLLHDGTLGQQRELERLADEVRAAKPDCQVVVMSARESDGEKIRDFYDLDVNGFPHCLVVRDDDQIAEMWSGQYKPAAEQLIHVVRTVSG